MFRLPWSRKRVHEDVSDEIHFHLERRIADLQARGMSADQARAEALRRFGDLDDLRESSVRLAERRALGAAGREWISESVQDLWLALRRLRKTPLFTLSATLTLAIAIGATASVFGVVDAVLLKAFPYRDPDRVVRIWESNPAAHRPKSTVATENFFDWQTQNRTFTTIAAACCGTAARFIVSGAENAERVTGLAVTPNYFAALGVSPLLGRTMTADTSAPAEVVMSYGYWQRRFGGSPTVIGKVLTLDNPNDARPTRQHLYTVVGVMPRGLPGPVELWVGIFFEPGEETNRAIRYLDVYGRLKPGVTEAAAQTDLATVAGRLATAFPKSNAHWSVATGPLLDEIVGPVRPALVMLLSAAACVLLIGATNLANLFLVRCLAREREMAVRTALGATRRRLVRELVVEASILGLGAGAIGVALSAAGVRALRALAPLGLPRLSEIGIDGRVVAFCALTSIATVFVFGLLPAWHVSRGSLADVLKEGGRGTGSAQRHRLQDGLVVLQVAVALVLLTGAGLLVESFVRFERMDPGFRPEGVLTAQIAFPAERYPTAERQGLFLSRLIETLAAKPGIEGASVSALVPAWDARSPMPFLIAGDPAPDSSNMPAAVMNIVGAEYFHTMGIRLERGRGILPTDDYRAPKVVVVDELLARRYFGNRDPIGHRLVFNEITGPAPMEIIGVVASVKENGLAAADTPEVYWAFSQFLGERMVQGFVSVRTAGDPLAQVHVLRETLAGMDRMVPISDVQTMNERMAQSVGTTRFSTFLASLFAVVALVLGMVGIYSVLAFVVGQRQREIAVRLALGARNVNVMTDVLRYALTLAAVGILLGMIAAWTLTRVLADLFLGVSPHDPMIFVGAAAAFAVIALVAASVPAFRTTRVNPVTALASS
jgi:predicted permease